MRHLPKPPFDTREVFLSCISNLQDENLKRRLRDVIPGLVDKEEEYLEHAENTDFHLVQTDNGIGDVTTKELKKLYTDKLAKKGQPARPFYDQMLKNSVGRKCPFCGQQIAWTLDHFLPKANYSVFSVTPMNLVPACRDCNSIKNDLVPEQKVDSVLHPYFDSEQDFQWLYAKVINLQPTALEYEIQFPEGVDQALRERIELHFSTFELEEMYGVYAASEVQGIRSEVDSLRDAGGGALVRAHLRKQFESRRAVFLNSWETACYQALMNSDEYCFGDIGGE